MKTHTSFVRAIVGATAVAFASCAHSAPQKTDFNEVSKQAAIMLQNRHYYRAPFDANLSKRIFDLFLKTVDGSKIYLLKSDVDGFRKKYENSLTDEIIAGKSIDIADEMFTVVRKRASERKIEVEALLKKNKFTFDSDRKMSRDRRKVEWAKNEAELQLVWANLVENLMLTETLRRENVARIAKEQGKKNPLDKERPILESVKLKFKRDFAALLKTDREEVANYMISALASAYGPHTDYFSAREMEQFMSSIKTELVGIGALLQAEEDGATKISGIVIEGPTDKQGELQLNDRIIGVDHLNDGNMTDIMFMKLDKVVELIRGKAGTEVKLKVQPAKDPTLITHIIIKRAKVALKDSKANGQIVESTRDGVTKRLGVLKLPSFYANHQAGGARCSVDIEKILVRMVEEKVEGVLFDLRGNGGGSLDEVRRMTGLFVGHGPVVQVKDFSGRKRVYSSDRLPAVYDGPLIVAIDKTSASASEILAGALQDYNRAVIVGDYSTYGKGTVQQPFDLRPWLPAMAGRERAGYLKPTIQKFYRAAGSSTQLKGVESDIVLPSIYGGLEVGEKYMDHRLDHDVIEPAAGFKAANRSKLFIADLKASSIKRVNASIDFQYMLSDVERMEKRIEANSISLDKTTRLKDITTIDVQTKKRNKERIVRFNKLQQDDVKTMNVYRLELDDLSEKKMFKLDLTDIKDTHMRVAKSDLADLNQTPNWPSQMNAAMREELNILWDLATLSKGKGLAKATTK